MAAQQATAETKAEAEKAVRTNRTLRFNNRVDAAVAGLFLLLVALIASLSVGEWVLLLAGKRRAALKESDPVWLPNYAAADARPFKLFGVLALAVGLAKELSGEAALERAQKTAAPCQCGGADAVNLLGEASDHPTTLSRPELYQEVVERRFRGVNRCC